MNENFVNTLARFEPEIKPEDQFEQSQQCEPEQRQVLKNCENFTNNPQTVRSQRSQHEPKQLCLFPESKIPKKAQISSSPGVSIRRRDRYRLVLGDQVLRDELTIDEAVKLANQLNGCGTGQGGVRRGKPGLEAIGSIIHRMGVRADG